MTRNPRRVSMYLEEVSVAARPALSATRKAFRYLARQQFCALICGVETAPTGVLHNNFLPWHDVCTEPTIPTILLQKQLHCISCRHFLHSIGTFTARKLFLAES